MSAVGSTRISGEFIGEPGVTACALSLDELLRADPSGHFSGMQESTQEQYRACARRIAACNGITPEQVVGTAFELAAAEHGSAPRGHIGYYLNGDGAAELARRHGWRLPLSRKWTLCAADRKLPLYLLALLSFSLITAWELLQFIWPNVSVQKYWLLLPLTVIALQPVVVWFYQFSWALGLGRRMPRMSFGKSIPEDCQTLIAVPALLTDEKTIDRLIVDLEQRYSSNPLENLHFCLLTDFVDAATEHVSTDEQLLARAKDGLNRLIHVHGPRFYLFHRARTYNAVDQCWMGYERKRGKIEALNSYLCGGSLAAFKTCIGNVADLQRCRYVIVLDADMQVPRGAALALIEVAAHPLHWPIIDPSTRLVVAGYGLMQPGIYQTPSSKQPSIYERLHMSGAGLDEHTLQVDLHQELFGEAAYWGKGIYDVKAFHECTLGRFSDNTVLSHDLLESCYVRCGFIGDLKLPEHFPSSYIASALRKHRWVRGDWSLLRWLRWHVATADGSRHPNPIPLLGRCRIAENILRLFVSPSALLTVSLVWALSPRPIVATILIMLFFLVPVLSGVLIGTWRYRYRGLARSFRDAVRVSSIWIKPHFLQWVLLVHDVFITVDAIVRASVRMVQGRKMLEWAPSAEINQRAARGLWGHYVFMWVSPAYAALIVVLAASMPWEEALPALLPVAIAWLFAPMLAWWISRPERNIS